MQFHVGLQHAHLFTPIVGNYYQGDAVAVPLLPRLFNKHISAKEIQELLGSYYKNERSEANLENGFFNLQQCNHTNNLDLFVFGHQDQVLLIARFDNLGKGASGAAIQNMNIMLGFDEGAGLE